jgi:transcriptional regulator with XRE-family HTH domain
MADYMTKEQVVEMLRANVKDWGAQARLAEEIGVSRSFFNEVVRGTRPPTGDILRHLGLRKVVVYERAN